MKYVVTVVIVLYFLLLLVKCGSTNRTMRREFAERKTEHFIILSEIDEAKEIAKENGKKLDFLIEEYKKNANRDCIGGRRNKN